MQPPPPLLTAPPPPPPPSSQPQGSMPWMQPHNQGKLTLYEQGSDFPGILA